MMITVSENTCSHASGLGPAQGSGNYEKNCGIIGKTFNYLPSFRSLRHKTDIYDTKLSHLYQKVLRKVCGGQM